MFTTIDDFEVRGEMSINNLLDEYHEIHVVTHNLLNDESTEEDHDEVRAVLIEAIREEKIKPIMETYIVEFYDPVVGMIQHGITKHFFEASKIAAEIEQKEDVFVRIKGVKWYTLK